LNSVLLLISKVCGKKFVGGVSYQLSVISYQLSVIRCEFSVH
jgi:ribosomal-protein-alanine N-acetyltransferase